MKEIEWVSDLIGLTQSLMFLIVDRVLYLIYTKNRGAKSFQIDGDISEEVSQIDAKIDH